MRRFLPLSLLMFLLADLPAAQEPKPADEPVPVEAKEMKAYPTLAPGHHLGMI